MFGLPYEDCNADAERVFVILDNESFQQRPRPDRYHLSSDPRMPLLRLHQAVQFHKPSPPVRDRRNGAEVHRGRQNKPYNAGEPDS